MTYRVRNIGIAVALAIVAALLTTFYVTNYKKSVQSGEAAVTVFVAARDIPVGTAGQTSSTGSGSAPSTSTGVMSCPGAISDPVQIEDFAPPRLSTPASR